HAPKTLTCLHYRVFCTTKGYEVCRRLKSDPKTQSVPVVMCSSKGEEFDRYWGMKQGADAYIAKPFQPTELVGTVKQLLRG
ncbi:MAG: response regulator, partial [Prochlorothrix sp.]